MRGLVTRMARIYQDIVRSRELRVGRRVGVGRVRWGLRRLLRGLVRGVLALRAVTFGEAAAQDTAEHGEADAADQIEDAGGEASGEIGVQEDRDAKVEQYREDVAEGATRHGVPPGKEDGGRRVRRCSGFYSRVRRGAT